jgi:hypothetical protein
MYCIIMDYKICSVIIVIIVLLYISEENTALYEYMTMTNEISDLDDREYNVVSSFTDSDMAANILSELHAFMINFLRFLRTKFIIKNRGTPSERNVVLRILDNYNPDTLFENDPRHGQDTSYILNKGDKFAVCLRDKGQQRRFHDENLLQFVVLHEMSHLGSLTYGHNREFWACFKFLLIQAEQSGLYVPVNYSKTPVKYCGVPVMSNPYFTKPTN